MPEDCPECGETFERLGTHFHWSPSHRPSLNSVQRTVVAFLTLVGTHIREAESHPRLVYYDTDQDFVERISDVLGWLAHESRLHREASIDEERDSDVYAVSTVGHPELGEFKSPESITSLSPSVVRWLILAAGEWRASGPFGSLWIDTRGMAVTGDHLYGLLRDIGVKPIEEDTRVTDDPIRRGHWSRDVVAVPHFEAISLLNYADLDVTDIPWTHDMWVTAPREPVVFD